MTQLEKALAAACLADVSKDLAEAYHATFLRPHGQMVLRDLLDVSGFFASLPPGADAGVLADHNARRATVGRLFEILRLTHDGREALAGAMVPAETTKGST